MRRLRALFSNVSGGFDIKVEAEAINKKCEKKSIVALFVKAEKKTENRPLRRSCCMKGSCLHIENNKLAAFAFRKENRLVDRNITEHFGMPLPKRLLPRLGSYNHLNDTKNQYK